MFFSWEKTLTLQKINAKTNPFRNLIVHIFNTQLDTLNLSYEEMKERTEKELEAAKADIMKKRVTSLEDERKIHGMLTAQLERNKTLLDREKRDQEIAKLSKADVDAVIKKYIKLDQFVEVMADQYGQAQATE